MFDDPPADSVAAIAATEVPAAPTPPVAPAPPEAPATVPPAAAAQPPAVPAPPSVSGGAQEAPGQVAPPGQPTAGPYIDPYDPAILSQHLAQNEVQATEMVAQHLFQLSPEEREALDQDVIATIPKLLAKVFVKSQQNVLQQMGRIIPMMMQRHLDATRRNTSNEDKFYGRWPDIDRSVHGPMVLKYAAVYRQMHPTASLEQMVEDLGPMIMMSQKIVPGSAAAARGQPARQAPPGANGRSPQPSPFVPAGGGTTAAARSVEMEPWEAMFRQE